MTPGEKGIKWSMAKKEIHPLIDKEKQRIAKRYRNDNLRVSIISYIISAIFIFVLIYFDISQRFSMYLGSIFGPRVLIIFFYFLVLFLVYSIITFPLSYIQGYVFEHKYNFSTQNFKAWFIDWLKSLAVSFLLSLIIVEFIYFIISAAGGLWWFWLAVVMIIFSVIIANLFPILILPLFYKTSQITDEELIDEIYSLGKKAKLEIRGLYSINLSNKTKKANAAVVGLGNTKRILLGDNLLNKFEDDEILCALAHEITHYQEHHIWWLIIWQSVISLFLFFIFSKISPVIYSWAGFNDISEPGAFPLFIAIFLFLSLLIKPIGSAISRYYERRADLGALHLTNNPDAFIRLIAKFCNEQLSIAYPNRLVEWYSYSHPSPGKRISFAEAWKKNSLHKGVDFF